MTFALFQLLAPDNSVDSFFIACFVAATVFVGLKWGRGLDELSAIPIIGPSGWFASCQGARVFEKHAYKMVQEGVKKYPGQMFRVPRMGWTVVVSGRRMINELRAARDTDLSLDKSVEQSLQSKYTVGPSIGNADRSHMRVIQSELTRNISIFFDDLHDEMCAAFSDNITFENGEEWISIPASSAIMSIVARTSNRVFVGLPLCRDKAFLASNMEFASSIMGTAQRMNRWPVFLQPLVGTVLSPYKKHLPKLTGHIGAMVARRMHEDDALGVDRPDRPRDAISWLLNHYAPGQAEMEMIVMRVMLLNFVGIHTTTNAFTHALYHLAAHPEYIAPLRAEVEEVIAKEGWTSLAMREMHRVDSFLRESGRVCEGNCLVLHRRVVKDGGFTFSDGTTLPKGTLVAAAVPPAHYNADTYTDPETFDGFRFSRLREADPTKYQMVTTDCDYVQFGHGQHACPGRFFAVNELKAMLAHLVLHYEVQFEGGPQKPKSDWLDDVALANTTARVLFRKRVLLQ
ncbi:cytochrome P450 [Schizophyllum amplum]|uniref:Cytochrome P450 n=1 Tax=Schizophyllum amplum TaxID=97359 RepID=A0A550CSE6_9AGAR|nr:cytochrome P450 [Auriculariopsis ampla]